MIIANDIKIGELYSLTSNITQKEEFWLLLEKEFYQDRIYFLTFLIGKTTYSFYWPYNNETRLIKID